MEIKYAAHSNGTPVNIICLVMNKIDRFVSYTGRRLRRGVPKKSNITSEVYFIVTTFLDTLVVLNIIVVVILVKVGVM